VPGATDDLIAVRKSKAPKPAAKHVTELPVLPQYEYQLPTASKEDKHSASLTAEELKVIGLCCNVCSRLHVQTAAQVLTCTHAESLRDIQTSCLLTHLTTFPLPRAQVREEQRQKAQLLQHCKP
jgi:hypothetical protein